MLPWKDSNSHRRNQNPTCYHYTTRQFSLFSHQLDVTAVTSFVFDVAKVGSFFGLCKSFGKKLSHHP